MALHDALTGLPNRRFLNEDFQDRLSQQDMPGHGTVVLLLDLDRFKPINDIHGHEVGDLALIETANRLRTFCEDGDCEVVRLGGDEFVVVTSGARDDAFFEGWRTRSSPKSASRSTLATSA